MSSTSLGIKFKVNDLNASYEVVGTSDNYSFQYELGKGLDLVFNTGDEFEKAISLKGNYGLFTVRVFAVSEIGIRSAFIEEEIVISAPEFENTFTFSNLRVDSSNYSQSLDFYDIHSPDQEGDELIVHSEYVGKNVHLKWDLIPPRGHGKQGESLSQQLLADDFFDHFEIKIKNGEQGIELTESQVNNSSTLQSLLSSASPYQQLSNYRGFELNISEAIFNELDLDRHVSFEIISHDSYGNTATGTLSGQNYYPSIDSLSYNLNGSDLSLSWSAVDKDMNRVDVSGIGIPSTTTIYSATSINDNVEYYENLKNAGIWKNVLNQRYKIDEHVLYSDGIVYKCIQAHSTTSSTSPSNTSFWQQLEAPVDYFYFEETPSLNALENTQIFGYSYYYGFQAFDDFGSGVNYNLSEEGLTEGGDLKSFSSSISIDNLRYRERGSDLIFDWDIIDQDGNPVDISQQKFIFTESDVPRLLGISGSLFDLDTDQFLSGITQGNNSKSATLNEDGSKVSVENLHNAKVFNHFEYTRQINNDIYGVGGFPADIVDFDESINYSASSDPDIVIANTNQLFKIKDDNSISTPNIKPYYAPWSSSENYNVDDIIEYLGDLYKVTQAFGLESSNLLGTFDETQSYNAGDLVIYADSTVSIFNANQKYFQNNLVLYQGKIYKALQNQSSGSDIIPGENPLTWRVATIFVDYNVFIYKALSSISSPSSLTPIQNTADWQPQNPSTSADFTSYIQKYNSGNIYSLNDLVYHEDIVYRAGINSLTDEPVYAETNAVYNDWIPVWERNTDYDHIVFKHVGIPEGGKRSVGIEIGILDNNGELIQVERLSADNPPPVILSQGFRQKIDSTSEVEKVKFNFNYAIGSQEKTAKVHLYRIPEHEVETYDAQGNIIGYDFDKFTITGADGLPSTSEYLVQSILGAANDTYGDNINQIIDNPDIPYDENGVAQITGYYYKILPFDDFGSGELYSLPDNGIMVSDDDKVLVYPKRFNDNNPNTAPGRVVRADPDLTTDNVPGPVKNFNGDTAFENFFLNWTAPNQDYDPNTNNKLLDWAENDIQYYEVWNSIEEYIKTGSNQDIWLPDQNTGYRKAEGVLYSVGKKPKEIDDPAKEIVNAFNIFDVPANAPSLEAVYKGSTNQREYFWVRAVDFAGNKSPFTGQNNSSDLNGIEGLSLAPGTITATDVGDFEVSITDKFTNTIALNPNNPFYTIGTLGKWTDHNVFYQGNEYPVSGSTDNIIEYTADGLSDGYIWWQTGNDYYNTGSTHPATRNETDPSFDDFNDGDFIIGRVNNGIVTPSFSVFANALIGTANIENAAIIDAKINDLSADKITAGQIKGHEIEIFHSGSDERDNYGSIKSTNFNGIDLSDTSISGFVLSGDGSFAFQQGDSALTFDDDELVLYGKFKQRGGLDYDFIDINVTPAYFNYIENEDGTFDLLDSSQQSSVEVYFRNSSITSASDIQIKIDKGDGTSVIGYTDADSNSLDTYLATRNFNNQTLTTSISASDYDDIIGDTQESIVLYFKNKNSNIERNTTIARIVDGKAGDEGQNGASVNIAFVRMPKDETATANTSGSSSVPADFNGIDGTTYTWSDSPPTDNGDQLFAVKGTTSIGGTSYTWGAPYRVDGESVAEVYIYTNPTSSSAPSIPSTITYDFTDNSLDNLGTNWLPSVSDTPLSNNQKIYAAVGLAVGTPGSTAAEVTFGGQFIFSQRTDGQAGASVNIAFVRIPKGETATATTNGSSSVPDDFNGIDGTTYTWSDSPPTDNGDQLFAVKGTTSIGGNSYTWGAPYRVDGESVAEVYIYTNPTSSSAPSIPSTITYDFTDNSLDNLGTNWLPSVSDTPLSNNQKIYAAVGLAVGTPGSTAAEVTFGSQFIFSQRVDGNTGNLGLSPTFRGVWNDQTQYINISSSSPTDPGRGDIVYHNPSYYICIDDASGNSQDPSNTAYWKSFGGEFDSVATKLLLTEDAFITQKLELGVGGNALENPQSGAIVSAGFTGGLYDVYNDAYVAQSSIYKKKKNCAYYNYDFRDASDKIYRHGANGSLVEVNIASWENDSITLNQAEYDSLSAVHNFYEVRRLRVEMILGKDQFEKKDESFYSGAPGFLLARPDDERVIFDMGGTGILGNDSYIRFDSNKGKIEIAGTFINNTVLAPDFDVNDLQFLDDPFGAFVGGGYNNFIGIDEQGDFNSLGSAITAGAWNTMESRFSFIGAGYSGDCRDNFSAIVAGYGNSMPLEEPGSHQGANFIGCGIENTISGGTSQSIVNGSNNTLSQEKLQNNTPVYDKNQGWLSPGFLGKNDQFNYSPAEFDENAPGWIINSWWPCSGINNWSNSFSTTFYGGLIRSVNEDFWSYSADFGWARIGSKPDLLYKNAEMNIYDATIANSQANQELPGVYVYHESFNNTYKGWYFWSRIGTIDVSNEFVYIWRNADSSWYSAEIDSAGDLEKKLRIQRVGTSSLINPF